jgi:hypothetical protein
VNLDTVKARVLTGEEIVGLTPEDDILVADFGWTVDVLVPAKINHKGEYYLKQNTLEVTSIYGSTFWVKFGKVFVSDEGGAEYPLIRSAGSRLTASLFFPGLGEDEVRERFSRALVEEFGSGFVERWNMRSGPVKDVLMDVWEVRREWVPSPGKRKGGKGQAGEFKVVERELLRRKILEAHTPHFMNAARPGWEIEFLPCARGAATEGADTF